MKKLSFIILLFLLLSKPLFAKSMNILVYPFNNNKGTKKHSWISAGMADTIISDLNNIRGVIVLTDEDRRKAMKEIELGQTGLLDEKTITKVGSLAGANLIFTGSYTVIGERIRVIAKLIRVSTGVIEKSVKIDGVLKDIFEIQDKVVISLMSHSKKLDLPDIKPIEFDEKEKREIYKKYKPALDAYRWYARGLEVRDKNPEKGLEYFKKAYEIDNKYVAALIKIGYMTGRVFNRFNLALDYFKKAEKVLNKKGETENSWDAYLKMNMGILYGVKGEWKKAGKNYFKSKKIYDRLKLKNIRYAILLSHIGQYYQAFGKFNKALEYYKKSKKLQEESGTEISSQYSALLNNVGNLYKRRGMLNLALKFYMQSKKIKEKLGLTGTPQYSINLNNIGVIYFSKRDKKNALRYYQQAKKIREKLGLENTREYASLLMNIGIINSMNRKFKKAIEYYKKADILFSKLGLKNTKSYSSLLMNIGVTQKVKKNYDAAMKRFLASKKIKEKLGLVNTASYGNVMINIGSVYLKMGKNKDAGRSFRKAYNSYSRAGYTGKLKAIALKLAKKYE